MALRLAQIIIGAALVVVLSRLIIKPLDGYSKLIVATLCAQCIGYLMIWSNTAIIKSTEALGVFRKLDPNKIGHLILPVGSLFVGLGFYAKTPLFVLVGGVLFYASNYLLTRLQETPFLQVMKEVELEKEKLRVKDITITTTPDKSDKSQYIISITNTGKRTFKNLRVLYEDTLLNAENFGLDTTHMPSKDARIFGEPVLVSDLTPGQNVQFVRKGWGTQEEFVGRKNSIFELKYDTHPNKYEPEGRKWCYTKIKLPNARNE